VAVQHASPWWRTLKDSTSHARRPPPRSQPHIPTAHPQAASTIPTITDYGLQVRGVKPEPGSEGAAGPAGGRANGGGGSMTAAVLEERAYKESVEELPDVADVEVRRWWERLGAQRSAQGSCTALPSTALWPHAPACERDVLSYGR
jgi:hypothetical protein